MAVTPTNVMVGVATMYLAPWTAGVPEPAPADTIALGSPWAGNWVAQGGTDQGVSLTKNPKTNDINIEEQITPARVTVDMADILVETVLAEDTIENMKTAYGGGTIVTTAAATGQVGKKTLTLSNGLDDLSVGFEGVNAAGFWRRLYVPHVLSVAQVKTEYRRAKGARLYAVQLRAICDPSAITVTDMTAAAL